MGRKRRPITLSQVKQKGGKAFVFVKNPLLGRTTCFSLGKPADVPQSLEALNRIFLDQTLWHNPPRDTTPARIYQQWLGG